MKDRRNIYERLADGAKAKFLDTVRRDNEEFSDLCELFSPYIYELSRKYRLPASERDDVYQEAIIGLYRAVMTYDPAREASFSTWARLCIRSGVADAARRYFRSLRISTTSLDEAVRLGRADTHREDVERSGRDLLKAVSLSKLERSVYDGYAAGLTAADMAKEFEISEKAVANAIYRVKAKIKNMPR